MWPLDHKTSNTCNFFIEISFPLIYDLLRENNIWPIYNYVKIWNLKGQKNINMRKRLLKLSKVLSDAYYYSICIILTVGKFTNYIMEHWSLINILMIVGIKNSRSFWPIQCIFWPNIPVLLKTGFVVQGQKCECILNVFLHIPTKSLGVWVSLKVCWNEGELSVNASETHKHLSVLSAVRERPCVLSLSASSDHECVNHTLSLLGERRSNMLW